MSPHECASGGDDPWWLAAVKAAFVVIAILCIGAVGAGIQSNADRQAAADHHVGFYAMDPGTGLPAWHWVDLSRPPEAEECP